MTEQEQIDALKARLKEWEDAALEVVARHISFENSIEMLTAENTELKAQVNLLRDALNKAKDKLSNENIYDNNIRFALQANPEHCLAKVKANAIEEYKQEQAEMKRMEFATKIMVSSI